MKPNSSEQVSPRLLNKGRLADQVWRPTPLAQCWHSGPTTAEKFLVSNPGPADPAGSAEHSREVGRSKVGNGAPIIRIQDDMAEFERLELAADR